MTERISPRVKAGNCNNCDSYNDIATVMLNGDRIALCSPCIFSFICEDNDLATYEHELNRCDNCGSDSTVLCSDCASGQWGERECDSCSGTATRCDECATRECDECSSEAELCHSCAEGEYMRNCVNCGGTPDETYCETCAKPECVVCNRNFAVEDVVCPACKQTKVADGVVTFDPNMSYRISYNKE